MAPRGLFGCVSSHLYICFSSGWEEKTLFKIYKALTELLLMALGKNLKGIIRIFYHCQNVFLHAKRPEWYQRKGESLLTSNRSQGV